MQSDDTKVVLEVDIPAHVPFATSELMQSGDVKVVVVSDIPMLTRSFAASELMRSGNVEKVLTADISPHMRARTTTVMTPMIAMRVPDFTAGVPTPVRVRAQISQTSEKSGALGAPVVGAPSGAHV